jgi:DMSO/TMAO reductase YedYZ molybdopterin-dependent catalytic subunit
MAVWRLIFVLLVLTSLPAAAQEAQPSGIAIELAGTVIKAGPLTLDDLSRLPPVEADVQFKTSKGEESGHFKGVILWSVFEARGIADLPGHNAALRHAFLVEGRDGYVIAFSMGEIAPDFGNAPIMIATELDGKPLLPGEGFRLIAPGDVRGARNVKDVVRIEVK